MTNKSSNKPLFYTIAFLLPVLFLGFLELILRVIGFGQSYPLFIASNELEGYMQPNPEVINRYFPNPSAAPAVSPDTVYFKRDKPQDSFRIVIQGGSSAAGFPFGRFGSLQGMLEQRFKRLYPDKNIEVINTAMAAVNSYTLLDFVDEVLAINPDLVLIYAGHNEYLGIMGAGSTFAAKGGRFATLSYLWLKDIKLYQLLQSMIFNVSQSNDTAQVSERTLMEKVAKGKAIPLGSNLYEQGVDQFSSNLAAVFTKYQAAEVPVLVGNLVSIEKGMQPFSSVGTETKPPERITYDEGMSLLKDGQHTAALKTLIAAKDMDEMRFRAPSAFNNIIAHRVAEFDNVSLVDVEAKFRADTEDGVLGYQHLLEHVHPTKRGYFLLAEAFVAAIKAQGLLGIAKTVDENKAWLDVPVTELNSAFAELKINQLTSGYPFRAISIPLIKPNKASFIYPYLMKRVQNIDWLAIQYELQQAYMQDSNFVEAARVAGVIADALPNSLEALSLAGQLYMRLADFDMAIYYQNKALKLQPNDVNSQLNLAHSLFLTKRFEASLGLLRQAKQQQPNNVRIQFFIDRVKAGAKDAR